MPQNYHVVSRNDSGKTLQSRPLAQALAKDGRRLLVAVAGGIRVDTEAAALAAGANILVVGRAITRSKDIRDMAEQFLTGLQQTEIDQYRVMTDF